MRSGHGKYWYKSGDWYDGPWKEDKRHGTGRYKFANKSEISVGTFDMDTFGKWLDKEEADKWKEENPIPDLDKMKEEKKKEREEAKKKAEEEKKKAEEEEKK